MSFQVMAWAVKQQTANAGQKLVLLMLANHTNSHTGQCNPSHKLLAEECSMGVSTLKGHLSALEQAGFISVVHNSVEGVSLPNSYTLNVGGVGQNLTGGGSESDRGVGQNLATNLEDKPINKPKDIYPAEFEQFWSQYPRKQGKYAAFKKWSVVTRDSPAELLIDRARAYQIETLGRDMQYILLAETWLNKRRFLDRPTQPRRSLNALAG
jgi:hypothetical protein